LLGSTIDEDARAWEKDQAGAPFDYLFLYSDRESVDSTEKLFFP
jgi:hypothetical protein